MLQGDRAWYSKTKGVHIELTQSYQELDFAYNGIKYKDNTLCTKYNKLEVVFNNLLDKIKLEVPKEKKHASVSYDAPCNAISLSTLTNHDERVKKLENEVAKVDLKL